MIFPLILETSVISAQITKSRAGNWAVWKKTLRHSIAPLVSRDSNIIWLVVYLPLWNIWKSVGMMTFPTEWTNKNQVPNHQPVVDSDTLNPNILDRIPKPISHQWRFSSLSNIHWTPMIKLSHDSAHWPIVYPLYIIIPPFSCGKNI